MNKINAKVTQHPEITLKLTLSEVVFDSNLIESFADSQTQPQPHSDRAVRELNEILHYCLQF